MKVVFLVTFPLALPSWLLSKFPTATTSASSTAAEEGVGGGGGGGGTESASIESERQLRGSFTQNSDFFAKNRNFQSHRF